MENDVNKFLLFLVAVLAIAMVALLVYNHQRMTALATECIAEAKMHGNKKADLLNCNTILNKTIEECQSNEEREMDLSGLYSELRELNEELKYNNTLIKKALKEKTNELEWAELELFTIRDTVHNLNYEVYDLKYELDLLEAKLESHNIT